MSEPKTLKQILKPLISLTEGDKILCIVAVKEWIQQKQKEIEKEKTHFAKFDGRYLYLQELVLELESDAV